MERKGDLKWLGREKEIMEREETGTRHKTHGFLKQKANLQELTPTIHLYTTVLLIVMSNL